MDLYNSNKYKEDNFIMPDRERVPTECKKGKKYSQEVAMSVYSEFVQGKTWIGVNEYSSISTNRKYAQGRQDNGKYKSAFLGSSDKGGTLDVNKGNSVGKRKAYADIDYSIMSPAPRIRSKVIGMLGDLINRVSVDAIDEKSGAEKESLKWGAFAEKRYERKLSVLRALSGLPQQHKSYIPNNVEELELFTAEGGFKLPYEAAMEDLLKFTFDISNWEENIRDRVLGDLLENGFAIVKDRYDPSDCKVKTIYCDIENAGIQYTKHDEFQNADYGYDVEFRKISDIRQFVPAEEEGILLGLAKKFKGDYGNADDDWSKNDGNDFKTDYGYKYDDYIVPVLNVAWIDVEYDEEVEHTNRFGVKKTYKKDKKKRLGKRDDLIRTRMKTLYECSWVIDTDIMIKYGKAENQSRDGLANPVLPYSCVKLATAPIIPQIIPALDQFMYGWIKFQQGMKMATIDGYSIDIGAISNLSLGGKKMHPLEVIKMWRQTGILFRKDTNAIGKISVSGAAIQQMKGGAGTIFEEALRSMDHAMSLIEQTTGINPIALGASPSADQGKAVTEYSIAGTNDILKGIVQRASMLKSFIAKNMCLRLQFVVKNKARARKGYGGVIGDDRLELLKIAEGNDVKYGMKTHARPQNQEKQDLFEMIALSLKNGRDGKVGITEGDAVRFKSMIENGTSLKRVALALDYANRKAKEEAAATAQQNIEAQGKQQQQLEALQAQNRQADVQLEIQKQVTIDNNKAKLDAGLEAVKNGQMSYEDYEIRVLGIRRQPQGQPMQQQPQQPSATQEAPTAGEEAPEAPVRGTGAEMEV